MTGARSCSGSPASAARTWASPGVPDSTLVGVSPAGSSVIGSAAAAPSRRPSSSARPNHHPAMSPPASGALTRAAPSANAYGAPTPLGRSAQPPAGHVTDRLRGVDQGVRERKRVGLADLDRLFRADPAAAEQVVDPVGMDTHRGDDVVGGDEGNRLARHLATLG